MSYGSTGVFAGRAYAIQQRAGARVRVESIETRSDPLDALTMAMRSVALRDPSAAAQAAGGRRFERDPISSAEASCSKCNDSAQISV